MKKNFRETVEDGWYWCLENWNISLIGVMAVILGAFVGWKHHEHSAKEEARREERAAAAAQAAETKAEAERAAKLQVWPDLPEPPLLQIGTLPSTPTLEALAPRPGKQEISLRLKTLVEAHPRTEVSVDFHHRVGSGELMLNFETEAWEFAGFAVVPRQDITYMQKEDSRSLLPTFFISLARLSQLQTPEEIREAWLVLYHENIHYEQWLAAPPAEQRLAIARQVEVGSDDFSEAECAHRWKSEREAYEKECQLAFQWGMPDVWNGVCRRVADPDAFSQAIFKWLVSKPPMKVCHKNWAVAAGHPQPEAFAVSASR